MATVRGAYESTVDRHYTIAALLIAAAVALAVGIVIGMLVAGVALPGSSAFSSFTGVASTSAELRQGGR